MQCHIPSPPDGPSLPEKPVAGHQQPLEFSATSGCELLKKESLGIARPARSFLASMRAVFPLYFPLRTENSLDKALHAGGAVLLHALREVAVSVQGKARAGVAQVALYGFDIVTRSNGVDRICMAEIMKTHTFQTGGLDRGGKPPFHSLLEQRPANLIRKGQAVGVIPQRAGLDPRFGLASPLLFQGFQNGGRRGNRTGLSVLWGNK